MSTHRSATRSWRHGLAAACALALLAAALPAAAFIGNLRGPKVDGELALPGLTAKVRVLRDEHGIPYIFAANTPDLIRAQGFVTVQDRLFQMEGYRAIATGRLAESIGAAGLASDRPIRLLGLRRNAERHAKLLSPEARNFLNWYAEGMNAYITGHADDHPLELKLAGFSPRPWTLDDMVTVLHFVNFSQAANFKAELNLQKLIDKFGADKVMRELLPVNVNPDRKLQPVIVGGAAGAQPLSGEGVQLLAGLDEAWAPLAPLAVGSNNWAIGKSRSASGAAVLVNDPHLDARMLPGIWHPVGLFAPGIQAVGAALPAVPGIQVGRTAHVAFGVTNAYGDSQDLFIEKTVPGKPDHYVDGDQQRPFQMIEEVIRIKDKDAPGGFREETMNIRATVRGPIISGAVLGYDGETLLSLRMASAELPGGGIGIDQLLTARNIAEVDQAAQAMDVIYFNYVFVDKAGGIGHRSTGRVPVRASKQGSHPKPVGASDDWRGFIPPDQMPGMIVAGARLGRHRQPRHPARRLRLRLFVVLCVQLPLPPHHRGAGRGQGHEDCRPAGADDGCAEPAGTAPEAGAGGGAAGRCVHRRLRAHPGRLGRARRQGPGRAADLPHAVRAAGLRDLRRRDGRQAGAQLAGPVVRVAGTLRRAGEDAGFAVVRRRAHAAEGSAAGSGASRRRERALRAAGPARR